MRTHSVTLNVTKGSEMQNIRATASAPFSEGVDLLALNKKSLLLALYVTGPGLVNGVILEHVGLRSQQPD